MAHVVAGLGRLRDDLGCILFTGLAQRPKRRRACAGAAEAEYRAVVPLERGLGLLDEFGIDPVSPQRNGIIGETGCLGCRFDLGARRLVGRFTVRTVVDDGSKAKGFERGDIFRVDLSRNADVIVDPLQVQVATPR